MTSGKQADGPMSRGPYARRICSHCRSRKVKCHLPDPEAVRPSADPLEQHLSCKRCIDKALDCIIELPGASSSTPVSQSSRASQAWGGPVVSGRKRTAYEDGASVDVDDGFGSSSSDGHSPAGMSDFLLANNIDGADAILRPASVPVHHFQPSNAQIFEASMQPVSLLSLVLARQAQSLRLLLHRPRSHQCPALGSLIGAEMVKALQKR